MNDGSGGRGTFRVGEWKDLPWLTRLLATTALGLAVFHFLAYVHVVVSRIGYPFALEWMEGGSLVQVNRILSGNPLYVRPSFEFVPMVYPPVYFYVSAAVSLAVGRGFLALRIVSVAATFGTLWLIHRIVREQTGSAWAGVVAGGLFCATFTLSDSWFDIARVDSLFLFLLLLSAYLLSKDRVLPCILGGLLLALASLTKQTAVGFLPVIGLYCLLPPKRSTLAYVAAAVSVLAVGTLVLDSLHGGWFKYYVFELPSRHSAPNVVSMLGSIRHVLWDDLISPLGIAWVIALASLLVFPGAWCPRDSSRGSGASARIEGPRLGKVAIALVVVGSVLCLASLVYLMVVPSDPESRVLGQYSSPRLVLLASLALPFCASFVLLLRMLRDRHLAEGIGHFIYGRIWVVPVFVVGMSTAFVTAIAIIVQVAPDIISGLTRGHIERLFPFALIALVTVCLLVTTWRVLWRGIHLPAWLLVWVAAGLLVLSWAGKVNPGAVRNVLMPGHAAVAILFGLGLGTSGITEPSRPPITGKAHARLMALLAIVQLLLLIGPTHSEIPSSRDTQAGNELVQRIVNCPGEVYIPFHTYISELAGRQGYAGWIEMAEVWGYFGGTGDPLWDEVARQLAEALADGRFSAVVHDNAPFAEALSSHYHLVANVFDDPDVFWPVTGWRIRPESVYEPIEGVGCNWAEGDQQ